MSEAALETEQYWDGLQTALTDGEILVTDSGEKPWGQVLMDSTHLLFADEPEALEGKNTGPTPTDLVLMALGACTAITCRMYAARKGWQIDRFAVRLRYDSPDHMSISRTIELDGPLDAEQRQRILQIAEKCPVHKMLTQTVTVATALAPAT
ncbi:MAG TPA: OsmC family protein [Alphaproteobacteria bacterium]|jgi:putative redox protein|nr:OsmC family protein [Alphaproteobacteria bacterium]